MGHLRIGYENLVDGSAVALLHSTEVAGFEAENVQSVQTSERFRTSTLSPGWIEADLGAAWPHWDLVACIDANLTPWRNLLSQAADLSHADWTNTGLTVAQRNSTGPADGQTYTLTETTANSEHKLVHDAVTTSEADTEQILSVYFAVLPSDRKLRIRAGVTGNPGVDINSDGTVYATNGSPGNVTVATDSTSDPSGQSWYRVSFTLTDAVGSNAPTIALLDDSGNPSYVGSTGKSGSWSW